MNTDGTDAGADHAAHEGEGSAAAASGREYGHARKREVLEGMDPTQWFQQHGEVLYRYALARVKDKHLAEDLVQDTLLAAWRKVDSFEGRSAVRTWLTGILRHKILDHWRRSGRWNNASDLLAPDESVDQLFDRLNRWTHDTMPADWSPEENLQRGDRLDALQSCIDMLPERLRQLFVLAEVEETERERVAEKFGISNNHLAVLLYRARQKLRLCLEAKLTGG